MSIILALSPPKVLLGLKPPDSPLELSVSNLGFLKGGIYLRSQAEEEFKLVGLLLIDSTYWKRSSQLMMGPLRRELNLVHQRACWSVFLSEGRKILSTKLRNAAISFLQLFMPYQQSDIKQNQIVTRQTASIGRVTRKSSQIFYLVSFIKRLVD